MSKKYRKKPVIIEALQVTEDTPIEDVRHFMKMGFAEFEPLIKFNGILIPTLEGPLMCRVNDYIIKGVQGEYYPCKPDIFKATYEEVISD